MTNPATQLTLFLFLSLFLSSVLSMEETSNNDIVFQQQPPNNHELSFFDKLKSIHFGLILITDIDKYPQELECYELSIQSLYDDLIELHKICKLRMTDTIDCSHQDVPNCWYSLYVSERITHYCRLF